METGAQTVFLPSDYKVLSVGIDPSDETNLAIWATVDPDKYPFAVLHRVHVVFTGREDPSNIYNCTYIGTVVSPQKLVYHLFLE